MPGLSPFNVTMYVSFGFLCLSAANPLTNLTVKNIGIEESIHEGDPGLKCLLELVRSTKATGTVSSACEPRRISDFKGDLKDVGEFVQESGDILSVCAGAGECYNSALSHDELLQSWPASW